MKHFMEMDLNEFDEKEEDNFSSEDDSLDFDFDEAIDDVGTDDSSDESTDETTTDTTETQDDASGAENYEDKYIEELKKRKDQDPIQQLEIAVGAKLPKDFAEGVFIFDNNDFADSKIIKDDKVVFVVAEMWPLKRIISMRKNNNCYLNDDSIFAIGDDGFGNVIVLKTTDNTYHVWYHDTKKTIMIAKAFDEEGVDPGYNISEEDTLLYLLKSGMTDDESSNEQTELDESTNEPTTESEESAEITQEGMFDSGFGNLRSRLADALKGRFKVTNVGPGGMGGSSKFEIMEPDASFDSVKTTVESTGTGCKVVTRGGGLFKCNFTNLPLSQAFEKIKALFEKPELRLESATYDFSIGSRKLSRFSLYQETDESTLKWINRDASKIAKMWKESQFSENHTKSVSDLINEYRKYYETNFRIKKPVLDKAFNVISKRLTELFNKGYICGGYVDGYKMVLFHKDWLDKDIVNKFRSRIDSNPAYLIYIDTETIPYGELGVSVTEKSYDYDGKTDLGNTRKLMKQINNNAVQESYVQEANEEGVSDDDEETIEIPEMPDLDEDVSVETTEGEDGSSETEVDISSFGTDTSDVQNDFDPKDVDRLNKLIAAESEAINDYFDASKDTRDEDLRTLFSDIGHEERFHLEQLMYSKSKITGEKYEPRDPEVKAEYEELINGGMDEDTAASTAMDKSYMVGEDDGDDSDMEEIEQESVFINNMLYNNELLVSICEQYIDNPSINDKDVAVFIESFIMESIDNVSSAPKEVTKIKSPFSVLAKGLKMSINGLSRMSTVIRDSMRRSKLKRHRRNEWLKNHSVADLFKGGIYLYLYNDKESRMDFNTPVKYVDFLYRLTKAIGESCGIKLTAEAKHKTVKDPIKFKDINEGMYKLSQVLFTKTKVVVTDANKAAIQNEFFGYNDDKIKVGVTHGTDQIVHDSDNIYNKLNVMILVVKQYAEISEAVLNEMSKLEGDVNSVYYKNRPVYNKAKDNMSTVIKTYNQFIGAMSHDLTQILKLDNGLLKLTRERDMTEQSGGKWEGEDIRVAPKQAPQGPQYTKRKK